jgi:hypothetical protein
MTTIVKLFVAAVLLNALAQASLAAFKFYQFEDAVHEALIFAPSAADPDIVDSIKDIATEHKVPLDSSTIQVARTTGEVKVEAHYVDNVKLVPGVYTKPWTFNLEASARVIAGIAGPTSRPRRP